MSKRRLNEIKYALLMKIDDYLDCNIRIRYLSNPVIAQLVQDALVYRSIVHIHDVSRVQNHSGVNIIRSQVDDTLNPAPRFILFQWIIMPNHVHMLLQPLMNPATGKYYPLEKILHSIKSYTAHEANKMLNRVGQFWQSESYDHIIRDERSFDHVWRYVKNNAVKARLCDDGHDFKWSYSYFIAQL